MGTSNPELASTEFITAEQRAVVASAIHRLGVSEAGRRLGLSNESVMRVAHGYGSQAGTEALTAQRLGRLSLSAWPCPIAGCKQDLPHLHGASE